MAFMSVIRVQGSYFTHFSGLGTLAPAKKKKHRWVGAGYQILVLNVQDSAIKSQEPAT